MVGRSFHSATLLNNGRVLIAGGLGSGGAADLSSAEVYDPTTGTFTATGNMTVGRAFDRGVVLATLLNNGTVLIAGNDTTADVYDPTTGTFTATGSMHTARVDPSATLLEDGTVLVPGGADGSGSVFQSTAELYEPGPLLPPGLVSIAVAPPNPTVSAGTSQHFIATGTFSDGSMQQLASVTWSSSDSAVAATTNDSTNRGTAFGASPGMTTVNACIGSLCGSTTLTVSGTSVLGTAAAVLATTATGQSATVLTPFTAPLQAIVEDPLGHLVPNVTVTFKAPASGASGTFANGDTTTTAVTDSHGVATAALTADSIAGTYSVMASVPGVLITATFNLTNNPGSPASITTKSGSGQSAATNTRFGASLLATVRDAEGNLVPNVAVTFSAPTGGASGIFLTTFTATTTSFTDSNGVATGFGFIANSILGSYAVTASVAGVSTTANFNLTNVLSSAASILPVAGSGQSTKVLTAFATPLQVSVKDPSGHLIASASVTFTAPATGAGGTFANGTITTTAVTDSSGLATASTFTANGVFGSYNVTASITGVIATATFSLSNLLAASSISPAGGGGQSATVLTPFPAPLQARVVDATGNPVPNARVTFTAPSSGARGAFADTQMATTVAVTDSAGVATASAFTAGSIAGTYNVTASVPGVSATATFALTNTPGPPASVIATDGGEQSVAVSTAFPMLLKAAVVDASQNLLPNVIVTFTAPANGPGGTFAGGTITMTALTDNTGVATASLFTANNVPGSYRVTASAPGVTATDSFQLTNNPGVAPGDTGLIISETVAGRPVSGGISIVLLDGLWAGKLDSTGSLTTPATPGNHTVTVLDLAGARGDVPVVAAAGALTPVVVNATDSENVYAPGTSNIPQIVNGVFPYGDTTKNPITIQFLNATSNPIIVTRVSSASLDDNAGDTIDLPTTIAADGTVAIDLVAALQTLGANPQAIGAKGPFSLDYDVRDANGVPYGSRLQFGMGIYSIAGSVQAPPSNPALPLGNIQVSFQTKSGIALQATADGTGAFTIANVPPGSYDVSSSFTSAGVNYTIRGTSVIQGNVLVTVVPLGPFDIYNNVVSVTTTPSAGANLAPAIANRVAARLSQPNQNLAPSTKASSGTGPGVPATTIYGPNITSPQFNTDICTFPTCVPAYGDAIKGLFYKIPKNTQSVNVIYQVCSDQSLTTSIDVGSVTLYDVNMNQLFADTRSVFPGSSNGFHFNANGCTDVLESFVDTSALTTASAARLTLFVLAQDSFANLVQPVPTYVTAVVAPALTIRSFTLDPFKLLSCPHSQNDDTTNIEVCNSSGSIGEYVSIPSGGPNDCPSITSGNCFDRPTTAVLDSPTNMPLTITYVELDVIDPATQIVLDIILGEPPGDRVKLPDPNTLKFSILYFAKSVRNHGFPSSNMNSLLPDPVNYLLTVTGVTQTGVTVQASKKLQLSKTDDTEQFHTLWPAVYFGVPDQRYGDPRDLGGDDWAAKATITWLKRHFSLLAPFNDISGEHGRNIGHKEHGMGTDVDIFHYVNLCGCTSGTVNYNDLVTTTVKGVKKIILTGVPFSEADLSPLDTLINFVLVNRAKLDTLSQDPNTEKFFFGNGDQSDNLADDWLEMAMKYGILPLTNGNAIGLRIGPWNRSNNKYIGFNTGHKHHIHVALGNF